MSENRNYTVSRKTLTNILKHTLELYNVGMFLQQEYNNEINGDFRKEVISDGVLYRLGKHYDDIYQLVNIICNDGKIVVE